MLHVKPFVDQYTTCFVGRNKTVIKSTRTILFKLKHASHYLLIDYYSLQGELVHVLSHFVLIRV